MESKSLQLGRKILSLTGRYGKVKEGLYLNNYNNRLKFRRLYKTIKREITLWDGSLQQKNLKKTIPLTKEDISELFKQVMSTTNNKQVPDLREINEKSELKLW